jgi:hypothetical protein
MMVADDGRTMVCVAPRPGCWLRRRRRVRQREPERAAGGRLPLRFGYRAPPIKDECFRWLTPAPRMRPPRRYQFDPARGEWTVLGEAVGEAPEQADTLSAAAASSAPTGEQCVCGCGCGRASASASATSPPPHTRARGGALPPPLLPLPRSPLPPPDTTTLCAYRSVLHFFCFAQFFFSFGCSSSLVFSSQRLTGRR